MTDARIAPLADLMALCAEIWALVWGLDVLAGEARIFSSSDSAFLCCLVRRDKSELEDSRAASQYQQVNSE